MDVRTDKQTHVQTGTITLDERLFCNVIKSVKHDKTESKMNFKNYIFKVFLNALPSNDVYENVIFCQS